MRKTTRALTSIAVATAVTFSGGAIANAQLSSNLSSYDDLFDPEPPVEEPQPELTPREGREKIHDALITHHVDQGNYQSGYGNRVAREYLDLVMSGNIYVSLLTNSRTLLDREGIVTVYRVRHEDAQFEAGLINKRIKDTASKDEFGVASAYDRTYVYAAEITFIG